MFERSFHFIPANKPVLFTRLEQLGADAYVFDLEDSVPAEEKIEAIQQLDDFLKTTSFPDNRLFMRINGLNTQWSAQESQLIRKNPSVGLVLPKIESDAQLNETLDYFGATTETSVIALIESFAGIAQLSSICRSDRLKAIGLGMEDLLSDTIFPMEDLHTLVQRLRTDLAINAAANRLISIDTISMDFSGGESFREECRAIRACGIVAKFSIHPSQPAIINQTFSPDKESQEWATNLCIQTEQLPELSGYLRLGNQIISPPKLKKARLIHQRTKYYEQNTQ